MQRRSRRQTHDDDTIYKSDACEDQQRTARILATCNNAAARAKQRMPWQTPRPGPRPPARGSRPPRQRRPTGRALEGHLLSVGALEGNFFRARVRHLAPVLVRPLALPAVSGRFLLVRAPRCAAPWAISFLPAGPARHRGTRRRTLRADPRAERLRREARSKVNRLRWRRPGCRGTHTPDPPPVAPRRCGLLLAEFHASPCGGAARRQPLASCTFGTATC